MSIAADMDGRDNNSSRDQDVVLGDDWVMPGAASDRELRALRRRPAWGWFLSSPLARKIITFNLVALILLVAGVLYLNPFRDSLVIQRERGLVVSAELIADVFEAQLQSAPDLLADASPALSGLDLEAGVEVFVFGSEGQMGGTTVGQARSGPAVNQLQHDPVATPLTDLLGAIWGGISGLIGAHEPMENALDMQQQAQALAAQAMQGGTQVQTGRDLSGSTVFAVASPIISGGTTVGAVVLSSPDGEIDQLVQIEREKILQLFVIAILVSVGLSMVLASTIANPLADLAAAAEIGRDKNRRKMNPGRVRIPDLSGRPDEIGRLSGALRGMVAALYDRIDANEQFAADVAHEIKNPLASLRSAVGTLRVAKRDDQREKLLDVIDHDVRRLDRLVSDISNASRLDSELVREEEQEFNLLKMLKNLIEYLGNEAGDKGIEFISDLPPERIVIHGLEARLAQVFVNLITNAISFCEDGDAIRVWVRRRDNRVLVVVEDTGPGIPEQALTKIFNRFYSERPEGQFGNNSGLGLAISKQIVEAHGGVVWAENIRPTDADLTSEPLGARFVVGLPL